MSSLLINKPKDLIQKYNSSLTRIDDYLYMMCILFSDLFQSGYLFCFLIAMHVDCEQY